MDFVWRGDGRDVRKDISQVVRATRERIGITQELLAKRTFGVSQCRVAAIENLTRDKVAEVDTLFKLLSVMNVRIKIVLEVENEKSGRR